MHGAGMELAGHTIKHESLPGKSREELVTEIVGGRDKIVDCGVPAVRGWHALHASRASAAAAVGSHGARPRSSGCALGRQTNCLPARARTHTTRLQEDIVGFRSPYLDHEPLVREVLHEAGFMYDR